jgi:hypothetical protein
MALVTYSDLQTTIANYLARSDLTSVIPDFIRLAQIRLTRDLRIRQMLYVSQAVTTGGDSTIGLPGDFLEMRDIHVVGTPNGQLSYETPNSFFKRFVSSESGKPFKYTVLAAEMQFAPVPDGAYTLQMLYYANPPLLSDTVPTNVWTLNCMDALLYGALGEAEPYLMNDARLQIWANLYDRAISSISTADQGGEYSGQPMSMSFN